MGADIFAVESDKSLEALKGLEGKEALLLVRVYYTENGKDIVKFETARLKRTEEGTHELRRCT